VSSFWSVLAIVKLQFSHAGGAGHRHGKTQQFYPTSAVQQCGFQADLCSMTSEYGMIFKKRPPGLRRRLLLAER